MYKKSTLLKVRCYYNLRKNQDTDLWIRLLHNGALTKNLLEPLLYFRFDNNTYEKRKNWENTKLLITIRYKSWQMGFCNLIDFFVVTTMQLGIWLMPIAFQKFIYSFFFKAIVTLAISSEIVEL